jgi:hypothetical protein
MIPIDEIRPEAAEMVHKMHSMNFEVAMLTGDHLEVAQDVSYPSPPMKNLGTYLIAPPLQICKTVAIPPEDCHSRLLPQEKLDWILAKQSRGQGVVMLGDGINGQLFLLSPPPPLPLFLCSPHALTPHRCHCTRRCSSRSGNGRRRISNGCGGCRCCLPIKQSSPIAFSCCPLSQCSSNNHCQLCLRHYSQAHCHRPRYPRDAQALACCSY